MKPELEVGVAGVFLEHDFEQTRGRGRAACICQEHAGGVTGDSGHGCSGFGVAIEANLQNLVQFRDLARTVCAFRDFEIAKGAAPEAWVNHG